MVIRITCLNVPKRFDAFTKRITMLTEQRMGIEHVLAPLVLWYTRILLGSQVTVLRLMLNNYNNNSRAARTTKGQRIRIAIHNNGLVSPRPAPFTIKYRA